MHFADGGMYDGEWKANGMHGPGEARYGGAGSDQSAPGATAAAEPESDATIVLRGPSGVAFSPLHAAISPHAQWPRLLQPTGADGATAAGSDDLPWNKSLVHTAMCFCPRADD